VANPPLKDKDGNTYRPDTFTRNEGGVDVETQAVAVVNPLTGVVIDLATQTTLAQVKAAVDNLLLAAADIKTASEAINAKTTGAVSVSNLPATQPVSGTVSVSNFPAESSGLTNTELRQAPVPVSGSVSISNFPSSSTGLTDAELRATPVPMNGTVTVSNLPANQTINGQVSLDSSTLSALENVNAVVSGEVSLSSASLAVLENTTVTLNDIGLLATDATLQAVNNKLPAMVNSKVPVEATASNITTKLREAFEIYTPNGDMWNETKATGDLVYLDGNAVAASYLVISKSPLMAGNETSIESVDTFNLPIELVFGLSLSQRTLGQEFSVEVVDTDAALPDVADLAIASISQATTTLTVNTTLPHGMSIGKSIGIDGVTDSRANYPSLVVSAIPTPTQFLCTGGPANTLPSLTIAQVNGSGYVYFRERLGRANDGVSQIFENVTATNCSAYVRSESGDALPSGVMFANHSIACGTTAGAQLLNAANTYAFAATTEFRVNVQSDRVQWSDIAVDSTSLASNRLLRTQVCPNPNKQYKLRIRTKNNKGLTVPVAQIVSIVKTGTTTATVTTDIPHLLTNTSQINLYGVRDQAAASFPNLTAATAITVTGANTFTVLIGTASTVTSYGGYVAKVNGGNLMSTLGAIAQVASTATLTNGILTLIGNAAWASALIGDSVELVGVRNSTNGATLGIDGAWRIRNIATTTLGLEALGWTAPANFTVTNCGGGVIKRTDLRISFIRIFDYERLRIET